MYLYLQGVPVHCGSATLRQSDRQKLQQQQLQTSGYAPARNARNPQIMMPLVGSASAPKSGRGGRPQDRPQGALAHAGPSPLLPAPQSQSWPHASSSPASQQPPPQPPTSSMSYQQQQAAAAAAAAAVMQQQMAAAAVPMQMPGSPYVHPQMAAMMPAMAAAAAAANPGVMPGAPYGAIPQSGMMPVAPAAQHYASNLMMAGAGHPAAPPTSWPMNANTSQGFDFSTGLLTPIYSLLHLGLHIEY